MVSKRFIPLTVKCLQLSSTVWKPQQVLPQTPTKEDYWAENSLSAVIHFLWLQVTFGQRGWALDNSSRWRLPLSWVVLRLQQRKPVKEKRICDERGQLQICQAHFISCWIFENRKMARMSTSAPNTRMPCRRLALTCETASENPFLAHRSVITATTGLYVLRSRCNKHQTETERTWTWREVCLRGEKSPINPSLLQVVLARSVGATLQSPSMLSENLLSPRNLHFPINPSPTQYDAPRTHTAAG